MRSGRFGAMTRTIFAGDALARAGELGGRRGDAAIRPPS